MATNWKSFENSGWTERIWTKGFYDMSCARIDPYFVWADVTRFTYVGLDPSEPEWVPVILELTLPAARFAKDMQAHGNWIRIPSVYRNPPKNLEPTTFCTATVTKQAFEELDGALKGRVKRFQLGVSVVSRTERVTDTPLVSDDDFDDAAALGERKRLSEGSPPAVVGIIDEGLAFAHERFRERERCSTRIAYFWNQETVKDVPRVPDLRYGWEFSKNQIDQRLQEATHASQIDEDEVYRKARHNSVRRRILHGTHVMDLAGGLNPEEVTDDSPHIICVELPNQAVRDTSGLSLAVHVLDGLRYILDRADRLSRRVKSAAPCPVVVNLSYGNIAGPHDGRSMLEAAIDELIKLSDLRVVVPAGNCHLSRCHARIELESGAERCLDWHILPDDATPSFLEIWLSAADGQPEVAIEVTPPLGQGSGVIREDTVHTELLGDDAICTVVYLDRVATGDGKMILIAVAPTTILHPTRSVAPPGIWRVRIKNEKKNEHQENQKREGMSTVTIDAWIQRDDTPIGFPRRGRQSRFEDGKYVRFDSFGRPKEDDDEDSYIKRAATINAIGTGEGTVVIGGYRESDGAPAPYSASGPPAARTLTYSPPRMGPDAMAISECSVVLHGVLGAGGRSGSRVAMRGTSVAAPQVTRWIAAQMAADISSDRQRVIGLAQKLDWDHRPRGKPGTVPNGGRKPKPRVERGGGGRLPALERAKPEETATIWGKIVLVPSRRPVRTAPKVD